MTDHDHHHEHHQGQDDTTVPADVTETHPRTPQTPQAPRGERIVHRPWGWSIESTRLDPNAMYDIPEPTRVVPAPPVSPIGAHTVGAAAVTPPHGTPVVATLNALLDDRDASVAAGMIRYNRPRRVWRNRPIRSVREEAAVRAAAKARHERRLERLELIRSVLATLCLGVLFLLIVAMGVVAYMILSGQMAWAPTRV
jgi:hypothetical protein